jgi:segregation and condensation protein B
MERAEQMRVIEALILASPEPISAARIGHITPECSAALARDLIRELNELYQKQDRAFEIWEVAGGYQVRTKAEFSGYLQQLHKQRPLRLSRAALETLSIVAYKQPATRSEIEQVRGVDAGPVLKSLMERQLVRMVGHREVAGRPMLYGTTRRFLEIFGLDSLKELPVLRELDDLAREKGVGLPGGLAAGEDAVEGEPEASELESGQEDSGVTEAALVEPVSDEELEAAAQDVAARDSSEAGGSESPASLSDDENEPLADADDVLNGKSPPSSSS